MRTKQGISFGLGALLAALALWPQAASAQQGRLFGADAPLDIVIEAPLNTIVQSAARNTQPHPATLTVPGAAPLPIQLSARGLTRRTTDICDFPPLRLDFRASPRRGTLFQGQERLKLATHCKANAAYENRVVVEYLAYRLYNLITPASFRVRAVNVTYRDNERRRRDETHFGFLIEDVDDVATRVRRVERTGPTVPVDALDAEAATRAALFEYMIGNLDWSFTRGPAGEDCCHNSRPIAAPGGPVVPVPYDFDQSGLVDSPYATPPAGMSIRSVRTRVYRGLCRHNDAMPAIVASFRAKRADILGLVTAETRVTEQKRNAARRYLEDFFALLDDQPRFQREVIANCRGAN